MSSWRDVEADAPDFAARVRARFEIRKHCTLATLRRNGAPRISGIEVDFADGELRLGMMDDSRKAADLGRDPRMSVHSPTEDPPDDPSAWPGEAKVAGAAVGDGDGRVRIDISEVVLTRVGQPADHLVVESWHPGRGLERRTRT